MSRLISIFGPFGYECFRDHVAHYQYLGTDRKPQEEYVFTRFGDTFKRTAEGFVYVPHHALLPQQQQDRDDLIRAGRIQHDGTAARVPVRIAK